MKNEHRYDDIIALARPASSQPKMTPADRAAQFSPFAALTGYAAAVEEEARLTDRRIELSESDLALLDARLAALADLAPTHPEVTLVYFRPDPRKSGGAYVTVTAPLRHIDPAARLIRLVGRDIPIDDVLEVRAEVLREGRV